MRNEEKAENDRRTEKRKLGDIGENVACEYLRRHGFEIIERNYLRKWGELDIVAKKGPILHFIEVKSIRSYVSHGTSHPGQGYTLTRVPQETSDSRQDVYRPEENLHPGKLKRLYRTIETYLLHKKHEGEWQLDLITVKIDLQSREARAEMLENIVG